MDSSNEPEKCRSCGEGIEEDGAGEKACVNPECPSNKRTKPICQQCRVIMEDFQDAPGGPGYKCPKCGVVASQ